MVWPIADPMPETAPTAFTFKIVKFAPATICTPKNLSPPPLEGLRVERLFIDMSLPGKMEKNLDYRDKPGNDIW